MCHQALATGTLTAHAGLVRTLLFLLGDDVVATKTLAAAEMPPGRWVHAGIEYAVRVEAAFSEGSGHTFLARLIRAEDEHQRSVT